MVSKFPYFLKLNLFLLLFTSICVAQQKFNPMTGKYETTTPDAVLKYNYMKDEYKYAFNPHACDQGNQVNLLSEICYVKY